MTYRKSPLTIPTLHLAAAIVVASALVGCVELEPLDPDKSLPASLPTAGQPPPSCGLSDLREGDQALYLHLIDVGQGDALLLQTPDDGIDGNGVAEGLNILIDAGNLGVADLTDGALYVTRFLERLGIEKLDYAIVTHAHADHYGGMTGIFDEFEVVNVVDPGYDADNTTWPQFLSAAAQETSKNGGTHFRPALGSWVENLGDSVDWGSELEVKVLWASDRPTLGESDNARVNNTSIVIHIKYGDLSLLLTGDAEKEAELELLGSGFDLSANILKVGHHGSNSSSTESFIEAVFKDAAEDQRFAAISSGRVSFSGTQLPTLQTEQRIRRAVDSEHLFSTEHGDSDKIESDAPGDDDITFVLTPDGDIGACYIY